MKKIRKRKMMVKKKNEEILRHTQNLQRFPGFTVVVVNFVVEILYEFHDFCSGCLFPKENQQPILGSPFFFPKKTVNFHWTSNKNTHFADENQRNKNSLRSASSSIFFFKIINHSTTTTKLRQVGELFF